MRRLYSYFTFFRTLILITIIICLYILNPIFANILTIYYIALVNLWREKQELVISSIVSLLGIAISIPKLNIIDICHLFIFNFSQLMQISSLIHIKLFFQNSIDYYQQNLINNGLLGLVCGIILIINLIKYLLLSKEHKLLKNQQHYREDNINKDGVFIGIDDNNNHITISDKELNQHTLVIGTTGSGKTVTLINIVESCCLRGLPLIYLDGKGGLELANKISQICTKYNRTLKIFTIDPHSKVPNLSHYNPLAFGNFTEWKNKIVTLLAESENKGQEHFQIQEHSYINIVCEILNKSGRMVDLEGLLGYIKYPEQLQKLANQISPDLAMRFANYTSSSKNNDNKENSDIIKTLEMFYYSHYGQLFSTSNQASVINLQESILNNEVVLFLFDAAGFKRDTSLLGKLIINDINSAWASFGRNGTPKNGYCIFDEFAAYVAPNMANILAMQRSNGLHAVIGTQSINAISKENNQVKRIAVELIANCNTFIIHKLNDHQDIELLVNTIGQRKIYEVSTIYNNENSKIHTSTKLKDEFILNGQLIRELKPGFGFVYRSVINNKPQKVKFNYV